MKDKSTMKKNEGNPIKLVWLIMLLSFSVGVFMVYIIWSTLTNIRTERENLLELKQNFISIQTRLESSLVKQKSKLADLLESQLESNGQEEDFLIIKLIKDYRRAVSDPDFTPAFEELERSINSLITTKNKLTWWASAYNRTVPRIPAARKEVESVLERVVETVDSAEGQQRLQRAAKIRRLRQNSSQSPELVDFTVLDELMTPNVFSIIRRDIVDLLQLVNVCI